MLKGSLEGINETALLGEESQLVANLTIRSGVVTCYTNWPVEFDEVIRKIADPFRDWSESFVLEDRRHMTLIPPEEVNSLIAGHKWFQTQFGTIAKILPPDWRLYTPSAVSLRMRQAPGEALLVIRKVTDDDWVNGSPRLDLFLTALNQSPLCEAGTARYLGDGSLQVQLSQAGLAEEQEKLVLQLARLYK